MVAPLSGFETNKGAALIGGHAFERHGDNPMLGWRGASRHYREESHEAFAFDCRAVTQVRERLGLNKVVVMDPFCHTPEKADKVPAAMTEQGLERGEHRKVYVMAGVSSNVMLAEGFANRFDDSAIGSDGLAQLVPGVGHDADSSEICSTRTTDP